MNTKLRQLQHDVSRLDLLKNIAALSEDEQNEILDKRNRKPFDPDWVKANDVVKQLETGRQPSDEDKAAIDEMRKTTFLSTCQVTGNCEL